MQYHLDTIPVWEAMDALAFAGNSLKLAHFFADAATNAQIAINQRNMPIVKVPPHRGRGAYFRAHHENHRRRTWGGL